MVWSPAQRQRYIQLYSQLKTRQMSRNEFLLQLKREGIPSDQRRPSVEGQILGKEFDRQKAEQEQATAQEQKVEAARQQARENLRPVGAPTVSEKLADQLAIRQALPIATFRIPLDREVTITKIQQPIEQLKMGTAASFGLGVGGKVEIPVDNVGFFEGLKRFGQQKQQQAVKERISGKLGYFSEAIGQTSELGADYGESFLKTIKNPETGVFVLGTLLATRNPTLAKTVETGFALYTPIYAAQKLKGIGEGTETLGGALGEASAYFSAFKVAENAPKIITTSTSVFVLGTLLTEAAVFRGGKRISPMSKGELRKQSFNAMRNPNIFFDKGEVGVILRSPELKTEFVKERVLRFGNVEGRAEPILVKDVQLGGRGSLFTDLRSSQSYKGVESQPRFRKLYPKGFGSQTAKIKAGELNLLGVTLVRRSYTTDLFSRPERGRILEKTMPMPKSYQESSLLLQSKVQKPEPYLKEQSVLTERGFRKGMKQELVGELKAKYYEGQRNKFISDLSGFKDLPKPKESVKLSELNRFSRVTELSKGKSNVLFSGLFKGTKDLPKSITITKTNISQGQKISSLLAVSQKQSPAFAQLFDTVPNKPSKIFYKIPKNTINIKPVSKIRDSKPFVPPYTPLFSGGIGRPPTKPKKTVLPPPPALNLPKFPKFKSEKSSGPGFKFSQDKRFTPSFTSGLLGLKLKRYPNSKIFSGFELR